MYIKIYILVFCKYIQMYIYMTICIYIYIYIYIGNEIQKQFKIHPKTDSKM